MFDQTSYNKAYYEKTKDRYRESRAKSRRENVAKTRDAIKAAKNVPCADCGVTYPPYVMDFDHVRDKEFDIGKSSGKGLNVILAEMEKCEVVCANCHRERTFRRRV